MPKISAHDFINCTVRSGLASEQVVRQHLANLKASTPHLLSDADGLADSMIDGGLITRWQAHQLLQGRYKGFDLGNYRLLDQLGSGGMSLVYLGEHKRMKREVAIKVLPKSKVKSQAYVDRFLVEARAAAALSHPNIVRAYDFDSEGETHFLVMERLSGMDLARLVKQHHPLPIGDIVQYIAQAADGLQYAHDQGLVHRDVKPANLMVTDDGQVKVLDMGLARLAQTGEDAALTKDGPEGVMGTADYLAPEQAINSHDVDHRVDIYGLGCTLYFALAAQPPFPEGSLAQRIAQHQSSEPRKISQLRPDCPHALEALCDQMMRKAPRDRIDSMTAVAGQLSQLVVLGPTGESPLTSTAHQVGSEGSLKELDSTAEHTNTEFAVKTDRPTAKLRPHRRRSGVPWWLWLMILALAVAAGWLAQRFLAEQQLP